MNLLKFNDDNDDDDGWTNKKKLIFKNIPTTFIAIIIVLFTYVFPLIHISLNDFCLICKLINVCR